MRHALSGSVAALAILAFVVACGDDQEGSGPPIGEDSLPAVALLKLAGDSQTAAYNTAVATPPSVKVVDSLGHGVANVTVTFTVTAGGGFVTGATQLTDSAGAATVGGWLLRAVPNADNRLQASAVGLGQETFVATALHPAGPLWTVIVSPAIGASVGDTATITASITSIWELESVTASVGDTTRPLAFHEIGSTWVGKLPLAHLPAGPAILKVTGTDIFDSTMTDSVVISHYAPPTIVVDAPLPYSVARPSIHVDAHCAPGCAKLELVRVGADVLYTENGPAIDGPVSLATIDGWTAEVKFLATDSAGHTAQSLPFTLVVESSPKLQSATTLPSKVFDQDGARSLYALPDLSGVVLYDSVLHTRDTISGPVGSVLEDAILFPDGALLVAGQKLRRWTASGSTDLTAGFFAVSGKYIVRTPVGGGAYPGAQVYDLTTMGQVAFAASAANTEQGVSTTGDLAWWGADHVITLLHQDTSTVISPVDTSWWNFYPLTDSGRVIFQRRTAPGAPTTYQLLYYDGDSAAVIADLGVVSPLPRRDYLVTGLAAAWTKPSAGGINQVWIRSPEGDVRQVSFFSTSSRLDRLGPDGSVVFINGDRRYHVPAGSTVASELMSDEGKVAWRQGAYLALLGREVFRVVP